MDSNVSGSKRAREDDAGSGPANRVISTAKRRRQADSIKPPKYPHLKDVFDYPEVFLNILSFLPAQDLVQFERVSRYWKRICNDQWLWKRIYLDWKLLTKIGTNWATGTAAQYSLSPSPSPSPATLQHAQADSSTPTKASRSGSRSGRGAVVEQVHSRAAVSSGQELQAPSGGRHLLELSPSFIFVAYPNSPLLHVHSSSQPNITATPGNVEEANMQIAPLALIPPPPGWSSPSRPDYITCVKVDSHDPTSPSDSSPRGAVRLVVFYQSGGFVVLSVKSDSLPLSASSSGARSRVTWSRLVVYTPSDVPRRSRRSGYSRQRGDPTVVCEFRSPVLIGCTERFYISVWRLPDLGAVGAHKNEGATGAMPESPVLLQTLHSPVSFHPAALRLQLLEEDGMDAHDDDEEDYGTGARKPSGPVRQSYRASLAYSVPLYPERWTLAIQDIDITIPLSNTDADHGSVECGECFHVGRSTTLGNKTMARRWPLVPRSEIVGVKGDRAIGIGLGEKCCVLAGSDNQIQVYEIPDRDQTGWDRFHEQSIDGSTRLHHPGARGFAHTASVARREIKHVQTLLAHASAITAIALDQGRCVSAGNDGRILVWQVDRAADVLPSDGAGDGGQAEPVDPADSLGGWVNVPSLRSDSTSGTSEFSPQPKWNHVEVRTPQRSKVSKDTSGSDIKEHPATTSPLSKRSTFPSLLTNSSLHQQILPIPPVTHPLSLASAAREYLVGDPAAAMGFAESREYESDRARRVVEKLAFNDDRIVGLVRDRRVTPADGSRVGVVDGVIKVWTFDA
ncbi:hypothetical protein QFC20_001626 [Naganishia adeliensis]|uniref:Uncharacterized protein n=1 Tax=Naganishia adeliensis TaxID=92952 RepID=A0ACC2WS27_9TREE|nr:hypothetical protein QFC20_001626 [Naganishia adeliensis]